MNNIEDPNELILDYGEFIVHMLPRDSSTATEVYRDVEGWRNQWNLIGEEIGHDRAEALDDGADEPTEAEKAAMISWQIKNAFEEPDDDITPGLWFCQKNSGLVAIICWGSFRETTRKIFGRFPDRQKAFEALEKEFIFPDWYEQIDGE